WRPSLPTPDGAPESCTDPSATTGAYDACSTWQPWPTSASTAHLAPTTSANEPNEKATTRPSSPSSAASSPSYAPYSATTHPSISPPQAPPQLDTVIEVRSGSAVEAIRLQVAGCVSA